MPLQLLHGGEPAPDFILPATNGDAVLLIEYAKPVALVFVRHLD